jgi:hypothetical protein
MDQPTTTAQLFDLAIDIERKAAALYAEMEAKFKHVALVADFWRRMHNDEIEHEAILTDARDRLPAEVLAQQPGVGFAVQVADARRWIDRIAVDHITTLDDAYELAHELEFSEVNAIFKVLAMAVVPAETQRRFVVDHIERHQSSLLEFGRDYDRDRRRRIQIRRSH